MNGAQNKSALITWLATLPENAPQLAEVDCIRRGESQPSPIPTCGRALHITAAANRAGVSRMSLYRAISAGVLKAAPLFRGGRLRILESDLETWLRNRGGT